MFRKTAAIYDELYAFRDHGLEAQQMLALAREARPRQAAAIKSVLDLGCATGLHAVEIARSGIRDVHGLDLDGALLERARARKRTRGAAGGLVFHQGDMTRFDLGRTFDAIVSFFGVVAYAKTRARLAKIASRLAHHLNPGGVAVIEPWHMTKKTVLMATARSVTVSRDRTIARASVAAIHDTADGAGKGVRVDIRYLLAEQGVGIADLHETHSLGLFTKQDHLSALRSAGLHALWTPNGPGARGAFVAIRR